MKLNGFLEDAISMLRFHRMEWKRTAHQLRRKGLYGKFYPLYHRAAYFSSVDFVTEILDVGRKRIVEIVLNPEIKAHECE